MALDDEIPFQNLDSQHLGPTQTIAPEKALMNGKGEGSVTRALRVMKLVRESYGRVRRWQAQARECQRFYDNHQWDDYDRMVMTQAKRPVLSFNEVRKVMRSICGLERMNRTDVRFVTRALDSPIIEDTAGDLATESVAAVDELSEAAYERSLVVKDLGNCGMGWFEVKIDFSEDLDGQIMKERIPWNEVYWDPNSQALGLRDSQWRCRKREMPRDIFNRRWPDMLTKVDAMSPEPPEWSVQKYELVTPHYSLANEKANPEVDPDYAGKKTVTVYQFQERYDSTVYRMEEPQEEPQPTQPGQPPQPPKEPQLMEVSEKFWKELVADLKKEGLPPPPAVRQTKTKYRQLYVANGIELEEPVDLPGNYWTLICATGEWDEDKKFFTGVVPDMMSPQQTKNKAISASLDFYLSNAKGGLLFEQNTFINETRARDEWTKMNAWIPLKEGGLKKLQAREAKPIPQGLDMLFQLGQRGITDVVGLGPEFFGMNEGEVGNQTQQGRMTAALAIFGWFFDEVARFRKEEAKVTLHFVREFMTDGQMMQIGGPFDSKAIPLLKSNLPDKYKMSIDESIKHNPNLKRQVWQDLQPMIPSLMKAGLGKFLLYALKFSPLPAQLVDQMQKEAAQSQGQQQQQQGRGKKEDPAVSAAKAQKLGADTQKSLAQARALDLEGKTKVAEVFLEGIKLANEIKQRKSQGKIDTISVLQSLVPGIKNGSNGSAKPNSGD